jgi:hypothetical protein
MSHCMSATQRCWPMGARSHTLRSSHLNTDRNVKHCALLVAALVVGLNRSVSTGCGITMSLDLSTPERANVSMWNAEGSQISCIRLHLSVNAQCNSISVSAKHTVVDWWCQCHTAPPRTMESDQSQTCIEHQLHTCVKDHNRAR